VVFAAGIYHLDTALKVEKDNQVLLGLGIPTLISSNGEPVIQVGNVDGVRIAGMLLQAGAKKNGSFVVVGG